MPLTRRTDRRQFLATSLSAAAGMGLGSAIARADTRRRLPVAAIVTAYRPRSHADVIVTKLLEGWNHDGGEGPALKLVGLYTDQLPPNDMSRALARKHGFPIFTTIEEAITLGTGQVQVAGVLSIGEHGEYPYTPDTNQHMYPRRRFFDAIVAALDKGGKIVPVFNDKHLAYNWEDAQHMYETARKKNIPFLAGSSLPVAWRVPPLTLPLGCELTEAIATGPGGLESYGFHALETLQCMVERRKGGETGVAAVQAVTEEAIAEAEAAGRWSRELLQAAAAAGADPGRPQKPTSELGNNVVIYLIEYRDGLKAAVVMRSTVTREFAFACRMKQDRSVAATSIRLHDDLTSLHFAELLKPIEHTIHTGKPAYPVERTLLTTGVLDALMHSLADKGKRIETPHLAIHYEAVDWPFAEGTPPAKQARAG
jgi:hypothetical protein